MIVVECNADQLLIECLGFSKKLIDQAGCKGKVINRVNGNAKDLHRLTNIKKSKYRDFLEKLPALSIMN